MFNVRVWISRNLCKLYRVLKDKLHSYGILTQEHIVMVYNFKNCSS